MRERPAGGAGRCIDECDILPLCCRGSAVVRVST